MRATAFTTRRVYSYDQTVSASFNEVRLTPAATGWQSPLESVLRVDPATWQYHYVDYWGTQVRVFEAHTPHRDLVVDVTSQVEVDSARRVQEPLDLRWDGLRTPAVADRFAEFLTLKALTAPPPDLAERAESLAASQGPGDAARAIVGAVHDTMSYLPGSTGVHTLAAEAWQSGCGVCQDYAHLVVGRAASRRRAGPLRFWLPAPERARGRRDRARPKATPGCNGGWGSGSITTRPTSHSSPTGTSSSGRDAITATSRRSRASSPAAPRPQLDGRGHVTRLRNRRLATVTDYRGGNPGYLLEVPLHDRRATQ